MSYWWSVYHNNIPDSMNMSQVVEMMMQVVGYSWEALGWVGGFEQLRKFNLDSMKNRGEVLMARGLNTRTAMKLMKDLENSTKGGVQLVEDASFAAQIREGDRVRIKAMPAPQRCDSDSDSEDERPDPVGVGMDGIVDATSEYGHPYLITLTNGQCRWFR